MKNMKVGLAQINILWEAKQANLKHCMNVLKMAKEQKVELLLFPEMTLTGFSMNTGCTKDNINTVRTFCDLTSQYNMAIGFGYVTKDSELAKNHYVLAEGGQVLFDYVKMHPFSYANEDDYFQGGQEICFGEINGFNISCGICYDLRFPEIFQIMSKKAELIVVPANWPKKRRNHWISLLKARAIENQCYVAGVNCAGEVGDLYYSGDSVIFNPEGDEVKASKILNTAGDCAEERLLIFDIQNNVHEIRQGFPVKNDRRESLYKQLW